LSLENTIGGKVVPQGYLADAQSLAFEKGLKIHLDGARVANAAVAQNLPMTAITQYFDSVSICLSKGLCAPVGSILLADERLIKKARRWRKMLGGGMRQAGILAAAAQLALTDQVERLADDHDNAAYLASQLSTIDCFDVDMSLVQTNMVFAKVVGELDIHQVTEQLKQKGILVSAGKTLRLVTHADISRVDIDCFIRELKIILKR
jgi:threonine aldolase